MRIFGTKKESIKKNRFVPVIFESNGNFYSQKTENEFQYFFEKINISENEILFIENEKKFDENLKELIYGFCENESKIIFGSNQELFSYLFKKMDEINDSLVKLKISRILNLNGQSKKLELDRDIFFSKKNININFDDKINFVSIDVLSKPTEDLLNNRINNYSKKIQLNHDLNWNQIILSEPNDQNSIYIDKFRFSLTEVFDSLIKNNDNLSLTNTLIENHNSVVSYNIENNILSRKQKSKLDEYQIENLVNFIKNKNNE